MLKEPSDRQLTINVLEVEKGFKCFTTLVAEQLEKNCF
jgi:hypothetical protein